MNDTSLSPLRQQTVAQLQESLERFSRARPGRRLRFRPAASRWIAHCGAAD